MPSRWSEIIRPNYDGDHFRGGARSNGFRKPWGGPGLSLLVRRSASLLLDAQVAQKRAQELALKRLVVSWHHGLPVLQIVIH